MSLPTHVTLVDVGPRDGLQNEKQPVATAHKVELVQRLQAAGLQRDRSHQLRVAEVGAADGRQRRGDGGHRTPRRRALLACWCRTCKGLEAALPTQPDEVVVFGAASEAFSQRNINCSIEESIERFRPVVAAARAAGVKVRAAISCALGCPYQGEVSPRRGRARGAADEGHRRAASAASPTPSAWARRGARRRRSSAR